MKEKLKDALCINDLAFVERFVNKYSLDERFEDENNDTLLLYSISDTGSEAYKFLIERGARWDLTNDLGETIMHSVIFSGDLVRFRSILNEGKEYINKVTNDQTSPLLLALALDYTEMAKELISKGADVNQADEEGISPIHIVCQEGFLELAELLIKEGADLKAKTKAGNVPIALAANQGHDEIVRMLYSKIYA